jgi:NAD(P)-dependent dehydrogenase (short-subunit alcohol dehydrogenase family)
MQTIGSSVFNGKNALVIGASGGIGRAVAIELASRGAHVVGVGRSEEKLASLAAVSGATVKRIDLREAGAAARCFAGDGHFDALMVCYGPFLQKPLHETTEGDWYGLAAANLALAGSLVSLALPGMVERGWGRILLFGGTRTDSIRGFKTNAAYAACKTGLASIARSVALEYSRRGVACVVACPGFVRTEYVDDGFAARMLRLDPPGGLQAPDEIARAALDPLDSERPLANGIALGLDAGLGP